MNPCTNCGELAAAVYCAHCGERQPSHHDLTVGHFAHETVHELVHLDSKLFRTLRELTLKPGHITAEYFAGRKTRYIAPLRLFLTFFALQFIAYTIYKPVAMYSVEAFERFDPRGRVTEVFEKKARQKGITKAEYIEKVDARWQKNMSMLQLANIVGVALVLAILQAGRRRYMVEHLVFAAHYLSFSYLLSLAAWPIYAVAGLTPGLVSGTLSIVLTAVNLFYLYLAQRRFYGETRGVTIMKTAFLWGGIYVVAIVILTVSLAGAMLSYR